MDNIQNKIQELREQIEQLETIRHKQEQEKIACAIACCDTIPGIHFQNIRNELFKRQFGFWKKVQDNHYNIEREAWKRKYTTYDEFDLHYVSSYPEEILVGLDNPPSFANTLSQGGSSWVQHYKDNHNGNAITYHYISNKEHPYNSPTYRNRNGERKITSPSVNTPIHDKTLAAILFLLDDLSTRVSNLEST